MQKIHPFLWFDTQAEEAMHFYCSVFKNSKPGKVVAQWRRRARAEGQRSGLQLRARG